MSACNFKHFNIQFIKKKNQTKTTPICTFPGYVNHKYRTITKVQHNTTFGAHNFSLVFPMKFCQLKLLFKSIALHISIPSGMNPQSKLVSQTNPSHQMTAAISCAYKASPPMTKSTNAFKTDWAHYLISRPVVTLIWNLSPLWNSWNILETSLSAHHPLPQEEREQLTVYSKKWWYVNKKAQKPRKIEVVFHTRDFRTVKCHKQQWPMLHLSSSRSPQCPLTQEDASSAETLECFDTGGHN